jgi:broad specificity phosphatase PhoE
MKRLFYVRHGETHMNAAGLLSGQTETPLTDTGTEQAKATGKELKEKALRIDLIVCSPYERAFDTACHIAAAIGYPIENIQKNELFIERTFGVLEGTSGKAFMATHEYRDIDDVEGSETVEALQKRAAQAFEYVAALPQETILVVGHGAFGRAFRRVVRGLPHTHEYLAETKIGNAEIVELI